MNMYIVVEITIVIIVFVIFPHTKFVYLDSWMMKLPNGGILVLCFLLSGCEPVQPPLRCRDTVVTKAIRAET